MRKINPRAWSIDGECWCTRVDYDGYKKEWSGIMPIFAPDNRSKYLGEIDDTNIIVEFPTGLKDKNGREIYEGDIVCFANVYYPMWVVWHKTAFRLQNQAGIGCPIADLPIPEVIGNIHENPELLGDTNVTNKEEE